MKKILSIVCILLLFNSIIYSQGTPQKFNYQGVARNANGSAIANEEIGIMISIQDESGEPYYVESHERILTNAMGLFTIQVGTGETNSIFANIPWGDLPLFMQVSMRPPKVGDTWMLMGTTELISMPYAIHAKEAETVLNNPSQWKDNSEGIYYNKGSVAIGTADAPNSAALTVNSQTQGFLPPRMTTVERDAIENPAEGLMIWNSETKSINVYGGTDWCEVYTSCNPPVSQGECIWFKTDQSIPGTVNLVLGGTSGDFSIDWGDGSPIENYSFYNSQDIYSHSYTVSNIFTIKVAGDIQNIENIDGRRNQINEVNISKAINLRNLILEYNNLSEIDFSSNDYLEIISLQSNQLENIDVTNLLNLSFLHLGDNKINSININNNTLLKGFHVDKNQLNSLDISNNLLLNNLSVSSNNLTTLDIIHPDLVRLNFSANDINNIDISMCNKLEFLSCGYTNLTTLNISNNINITDLLSSYMNNHLDLIGLENMTKIKRIVMGFNHLSSNEVDNILSIVKQICITNSIYNGELHLGQEPDAPPSASGINDKNTLINTYNWTVLTD